MKPLPPLFIPLKAEHFDAFERGEKTTEFRVHGPRWNSKTCPPGREVILSRGYGKQSRLSAIIESAGVCPTKSPAFVQIYGDSPDIDCWAINVKEVKKL